MQTKETKYKNIVFRSRLEARWAVFFDALNIRWKYEPEGYVLKDGTSYLPDFYLENIGGHIGKDNVGVFVEVKGKLTDYDKRKISGFEFPIFVLGDIPDSTAVWKDIYVTHADDEFFMFSEYTLDHYIGPVWFAECGSGIKLLRRNECSAKGFINWCEKACERARNYKFEYTQQSDDWTSSSGKNNANTNYYSGINDYYSQALNDLFKAFDPSEQKKREEEKQRKADEEIRNLKKISVQRVRDILISEPGIIEYGLDKRLQIYALSQEIPIDSNFSVSRDIQNKRLFLSYEYNLKNAYVFPSRITDKILYIDLTVNNETTRYSEDAEYNRMCAVINSVLDLLKEEIHYESGSNAGYDQFVNKKKRRAEIVHDTIEKAKIEERKRLEAERIDSEEKERFFTINNRLSVGEFFTCLKSELLKVGNDKYVKEFDSLRLVDGVDFDTKFGLGSITFKKYADEIILSIHHNYSMYGINGKHYNYTDRRDLIQLDCMFEDLLDQKAIRQKQSELISTIEGPLRRVEGMFIIKQQKMGEDKLY